MKNSTRSTDHFYRVVGAIATTLALGGFAAILAKYKFRPTVGTVLLTFGWLAIIGFFYLAVRGVRALFTGDSFVTDLGVNEGRREELQREKRFLLKAIKEVEFDQQTGKIDDADAQLAIGFYRARALQIMKLLEEDGTTNYEVEIERELKRRMKKEVVPEKTAEPAKPGGLCPGCGSANDRDALFCKICGMKLQEAKG